MDKLEGSQGFLKIINNYKIEDFVLKRIFKKTITKNNEDNIRDVLLERNKNVNKHEIEEDEAEKLTNVVSNSNGHQRFKSVIMGLPEQQKAKIDRKEMLKFLNKANEKTEITSNFFETSIKTDSKFENLKSVSYNNFLSRSINPNKLETIYEKNKSDTIHIKEKKNRRVNHYEKNMFNKPLTEYFVDNQELKGTTKNQIIQSNYTYTDSVKTTCDSRVPSGIKQEKDLFISVISGSDIAPSIFFYF